MSNPQKENKTKQRRCLISLKSLFFKTLVKRINREATGREKVFQSTCNKRLQSKIYREFLKSNSRGKKAAQLQYGLKI